MLFSSSMLVFLISISNSCSFVLFMPDRGIVLDSGAFESKVICLAFVMPDSHTKAD